MMDELELLKKDWQKKEEHLPKLSFDEIYKMIWKKSSSIVKWIFYISIIEFLFWIAMSFIPMENDELTGPGSKTFQTVENIVEVLGYLVIVYFIFKFYLNYKKINTTDSARALMKKIIVTRKTVMQYVWFNLGLFAVLMIIVFLESILYNAEYADLSQRISEAGNPILIWFIVGLLLAFTIVLFGILLWLFYRLLYGILLKRLNINYRELKKLEV
ncbi:hypothetical protein MTsPCn9_12230 [Croceitalea sp. MTPC9]|nr:hypothetical protein MTsPCn6_31410 [Croceitalea sp. MTPC6]GMN16287.1 hypothetical protein MTsPCn9_12230 [Croceitalea sp. MTPC9]